MHGNYIKQLPADLSDVFPNLEDLDLTNNPLTDNVQSTSFSDIDVTYVSEVTAQIEESEMCYEEIA